MTLKEYKKTNFLRSLCGELLEKDFDEDSYILGVKGKSRNCSHQFGGKSPFKRACQLRCQKNIYIEKVSNERNLLE
jgi:hypothetical protein